MAISVDNNRTYRLRDLRDNAVPRDKSEVRAPSRRAKFEDRLSHPKAGQVVGEFPAKFDKTKDKPQLRRNPVEVAAERQRPRQAVAALMAKEGLSTFTKFGARFGAGTSGPAEEKKEEQKVEQKAAWMTLLDDDGLKRAEKSASDRALEDRLKRISDQQKELDSLNKFSTQIDGYSALSTQMKSQDQRVLREAGKLERSSFNDLRAMPKEKMNLELMKKEMAMNQQLNMQYLALQDKLQRGLTSLLSNLLKVRSECTKNSISGS